MRGPGKIQILVGLTPKLIFYIYHHLLVWSSCLFVCGMQEKYLVSYVRFIRYVKCFHIHCCICVLDQPQKVGKFFFTSQNGLSTILVILLSIQLRPGGLNHFSLAWDLFLILRLMNSQCFSDLTDCFPKGSGKICKIFSDAQAYLYMQDVMLTTQLY